MATKSATKHPVKRTVKANKLRDLPGKNAKDVKGGTWFERKARG